MSNSAADEQKTLDRATNSTIRNCCEGRIYRNAGNMPLLEILALERSGTALDVGCGAGANARILAALGWSVFGITLSPTERASAEPACFKVWVHDLERGLPEEAAGSYDLVILSHVLEHLRNPESLLSQINQVVMPGGQIAVALPNILNWHQRLLFLAGRFEYSEEGIMDNTHLRFYTFSSAWKMLEKCGFRVVRARGSGSILPWGPLRRLIPFLLLP
jgi:2-polyprenyl-3-methyl-5-hydroxy-6-metoxy-1,4-benzoquinol methylase